VLVNLSRQLRVRVRAVAASITVAALLATRVTTELFWQIRGLVVGGAGECVANNIFQADRREPCVP
jgi:hypothetical protein